MRVTVFGAGGVGGFLAGTLGALLNEKDGPVTALSIVARGSHLEAIRSRGLTLTGQDGSSRTVRPTAAADDPGQLPPADLVLLCIKGYDLDAAVDALEPTLTSGTAVLPLLNGADIDERVRSRLSGATVLPGCIYISAYIQEPGSIRHAAGPGKVFFGPDVEGRPWQPDPFLGACEKAEVPVEWKEDVLPAIWEKFLFIAPFSLVTAVSGEPLGGVLSKEALRNDARSIVAEATQIAREKGVVLPKDIVESTMAKAANFAPDTRTSFQRDVEAAKPRDERESFSGTILRLGGELGLATPVTRRYAEALPTAGS